MKKNKKVVVGGATALVVLFLVFFLVGEPGIGTFFHARKQISELNRQIAESHRALDSLKKELSRLENDTVYIEKIAREKYGMARKNETMYKFTEEK